MISASMFSPWWDSLRSTVKGMGLFRRIPIYSVASGLVVLAGLAREMIVASTFGLSGELDVLVAVMGFHLLFGVQVGNAIESVFVSKTASHECAAIRPLLKGASLILLAINVVALTGLVIGSRALIQWAFPQFTLEQCDTGVRLIRLLLFPIACAGLAGLMRGGLTVTGSFTPGFLSGAIVSVSTIISVLVFAEHWGIDAIILGFAFGHFLVLLWFITLLFREHLPRETIAMGTPRVQTMELWRPVGIVLIGEVLFQAIAMTERSFASGIGTGKIAAFFYAGSVVAVPLALFTSPVNTMVFPRLARAFHSSSRQGRDLLIRYGILLLGVTSLLSVILTFGSEPLIQAALARGKFSTADAQLTAHILSVLVWGLPFASLYGMVRNSFYSLSDYRTPLMGYGMKWLTLVLCGSWLIPSFGVDGLALASVLAQAADTGVMGWLLQRRLVYLQEGV